MRPHELKVAIDLAGTSAACRALRGKSSEWHRPPTERQMTAHHEAGHIVVAEAVGWFAIWGLIDPITGSGRAYVTDTLEADADSAPSTEGPAVRDGEKIAFFCRVMGGDEGYESLRESLQAEVNAIVEQNWQAIERIADVLEHEGAILRPEILKICAEFPATA